MSRDGNILVFNSGSSSLKLAVFRRGASDEELLLEGSADGIGRPDGTLHLRSADGATVLERDHTAESQAEALAELASALTDHLGTRPFAVGHRVVHGGPHLREHQRITPEVLQQLEASVHFAPLHIPEAVRAIRQAEQRFPDAVQIACFDTAFHRTMPAVASRFPIPRDYADAGVQRYGFHGLSCESVMHRLGQPAPSKVMIAHLGGGCSLTAVRSGASIDTTMGMSPTGGIPMGTRSGDLDPAVLLYLLRSGLDAEALEDLLNHRCGLFALSDGESDMQALLAREAKGDKAAALAIEVFCTDIRKQIGAYAALMDGIDLLVFTGGIGQHGAAIRARILAGLTHLGLSEAESSPLKVTTMSADEEIQIARHCRAIAS